jgi:parallel beta-helix repeat protein
MSYPRKYAVATAAGDHLKDLDWDPIVDAANGMTIAGGITIQYPYSFIVRNVGGVYDAINDNGVLTYGGSSDAGGVDGGDANAVLQAACNNAVGGLVFIRKGSYLVHLTISNAITLIGEGSGTILKLPDGEDKNVIEMIGATNVNLFNFQIDGNKANQSATILPNGRYGNGVYMYNVAATLTNHRVENLIIHDTVYHGIQSDAGSQGNHIENNTISTTSVMGYGILICAANSIQPISNWVINNAISNTGNLAIRLVESANVLVSGNQINNSDGIGIAIDGFVASPSFYNTLTFNTIKLAQGSGIEIGEYALTNTVSYNLIADGTGDGIKNLSNSESNMYIGNTIVNNDGYGINVVASSFLLIQNNIIRSNGANPIIGIITESLVTGNYMSNNVGAAYFSNADKMTITGNWIDARIQIAGTSTYGTVTGNHCTEVFYIDAATQIVGNDQTSVTPPVTFNSGNSTGTGADQTIAHGLTGNSPDNMPNHVDIIPTGTGVATSNVWANGTSIHCTVTNGAAYKWSASIV